MRAFMVDYGCVVLFEAVIVERSGIRTAEEAALSRYSLRCQVILSKDFDVYLL